MTISSSQKVFTAQVATGRLEYTRVTTLRQISGDLVTVQLRFLRMTMKWYGVAAVSVANPYMEITLR
jgi:hypothetical protein